MKHCQSSFIKWLVLEHACELAANLFWIERESLIPRASHTKNLFLYPSRDMKG